jgi:hypothetical protein
MTGPIAGSAGKHSEDMAVTALIRTAIVQHAKSFISR